MSEEALGKFRAKNEKNQDEALLEAILIDHEPYQIDLAAIQNIEKLYLIKRRLPNAAVTKISEIYYDGYNFTKTRCVPVYRDILVFKKNDSVVGLSKICFDCDIQHTIDKYGNRKEFDNADFAVLKQILE